MRKTLTRRWFAALFTLALVLSAAPAAFAAANPVITVSLDHTSLILPLGPYVEESERTLAATVSENGAASTEKVTWDSSDTNVVTVGRDTGVLETVGTGTATVTATCGTGNTAVTAACTVTVVQPAVLSIDAELYQEKKADGSFSGEVDRKSVV